MWNVRNVRTKAFYSGKYTAPPLLEPVNFCSKICNAPFFSSCKIPFVTLSPLRLHQGAGGSSVNGGLLDIQSGFFQRLGKRRVGVA